MCLVSKSRVSNAEVIAAYEATHSVWAAGRVVGLSGQTVQERLVALGVTLNGSGRAWSDAEDHRLADMLVGGESHAQIARHLGRTQASIAVRAHRLGLTGTAYGRSRRPPARQRSDKTITVSEAARRLEILEQAIGTMTFTQVCHAHGWSIEMTVRALERHARERWDAYRSATTSLPNRRCEYCGIEYPPTNKRQRFCTRACASDSRADKAYFGGRRRDTVGLAERTCYVCRRRFVRGLAAHHVAGKENDPDNDLLIALCTGCHQLVGHLAGTDWLEEDGAVERLLVLAWLRKHGGDLVAQPGGGVRVCVQFEPVLTDEDGGERRWSLTRVASGVRTTGEAS